MRTPGSKAKVGASVALLAAVLLHGAAMASPWAEAGDRQLRSDIELLSRHGLISGPVTAWPIPWKQITARLRVDPEKPLPVSVRSALYRVYDKMPKEEDIGSPRLSLEARATNRAKIGRDFGDSARDELDGRASVELSGRTLSGRLSVGYQGNDSGDHLAFDDSYLAAALGNWTLYGGWVDHWWGPGWSSSLILSTNARPTPRVGIMRLDPKPFETKWLNWLGPWQFNLFAGKLDDKEQYIPNPYTIGMRLTINPIRNLEIGLSRTIMICGQGQRCDLSTWGKALAGGFGLDNPRYDGLARDASNQLGGFDIKYGFAVGDETFMTLYGQMIGEDSWKTIPVPNKYSALAGLSLDGPWGNEGASWRLIGEYSDTVAFLSPGRQYNVTYNHFRYLSGYRYHGVSMADRWDGDSKAVYVSGLLTDKDGWTYRLGYQYARVNIDDAGLNGVSLSYEKINLLESGLTIPSPLGTVGLNLWVQDDSPNTPNRKDGKAGIEVDWSARF